MLLCAYFSPTDINKTDHLYTWSSTDQFTAATLSGPSLYYNTLGDRSNCRCVPFHKEKRYEMYALEDIPAGTELTMRYDSMNWRDAMQEGKQALPLSKVCRCAGASLIGGFLRSGLWTSKNHENYNIRP